MAITHARPGHTSFYREFLLYPEDSFFTLSQSGQLGLVLLSIGICAGIIYAIYRASRNLPLWGAVGLAIFGFGVFEWLSPQIYYFYYWFYFDGLPIQSVIRLPPSPQRLLQLMLFAYEHTLSAHGRGLLAWSLVASAFWGRKARRPVSPCRPGSSSCHQSE